MDVSLQTDNYLVINRVKKSKDIIDIKVDERINVYDNEEEFRYMRYTSVNTVDADDYSNNYRLRNTDENIELCIGITMYNENSILFNKTIYSIQDNIKFLMNKKNSSTWNADSWNKIVICIIADGRDYTSKEVLNILGVMGVYQCIGRTPNASNNELFEYTTRIYIDENNTIQNGYPMRIKFFLKSENKKKINSHRWLFNAFARIMNPKVCILLDMGTKLNDSALYYLWKTFKNNKNCGGACGEIYVDRNKLWNPIVAAQNFEYKISNILDKPLESICGYISVLPGAFSAYRYEAIVGYPLECYFKGEKNISDVFAANMYLAEDRILCFELITKKNSKWLLQYVKEAKAETDVPESLVDLIKQRRRWINGSFFASLYALTHYYNVILSGHSFIRKIILMIEFFYNTLTVCFSWINLSSLYLTFYFLSNGSTRWPDPFYGQDYLISIINAIYILSLLTIFVISLGNRPDSSEILYKICMYVFTFIMFIIIYLSIFIIYEVVRNSISGNFYKFLNIIINDSTFRNIILSLLITFCIYFISAIFYLELWSILTCIFQYFILLPTFINILTVYAFCNINDITWGTRGKIRMSYIGNNTFTQNNVEIGIVNYDTFLDSVNYALNFKTELKPKKTRLENDDYFKKFRTKILLGWVISNVFIILLITNSNISGAIYSLFSIKNDLGFNPYLTLLFYCMAFLNICRFLGCIIYIITHNISNVYSSITRK